MKTTVTALVMALVLAGCGRSSDEEPAAQGAGDEPVKKEVTVPSLPQPTGPINQKRPHRGTLNITQNDLDRTKDLRKQQMEDLEKNR